MTIIIALVWTLGTLLTLRHVGYSENQTLLSGRRHSCQNICNSCICTGCSKSAFRHTWARPCRGAEWAGFHPSVIVWTLPLCLAVWPIFAFWYVLRALGIGVSFFAPAPKVLSRQERADKRINDLEARLAAAEAEGDRLMAVQKEIYEQA